MPKVNKSIVPLYWISYFVHSEGKSRKNVLQMNRFKGIFQKDVKLIGCWGLFQQTDISGIEWSKSWICANLLMCRLHSCLGQLFTNFFSVISSCTIHHLPNS